MGTLGRHKAILLTTSKRGMSVAYTRATSVAISFAKFKPFEILQSDWTANILQRGTKLGIAVGLTPDLSFFIEVGPLSIHMHEQHYRDGKFSSASNMHA